MGASVSHETFESINADDNDGCNYYATFKDNYFADGVSRYAFKGRLHGYGPRDNTDCVTKVFKSEYAKTFVDWAPDLAASKKAMGLAEEFQRKYYPRLRNYTSGYEIEFLIPLIARMQKLSKFKIFWLFTIREDDTYVKLYEHVAIEPFIPGTYEKFNSNGGWEGFDDLMKTFCHWTWHVSGQKYMVCDLQGVKSWRKFTLTDPAIHSVNQEFGSTDLGEYGMIQVLGNHQCNELCRELGLSNPYTGIYANSGPRSTTYSFQVTEQEMLRARRIVKDY